MTTELTDREQLHRIRLNVHRLTTDTFPPEEAEALALGARRRPATRRGLVAELRDAIRPDQGGSGKGGSEVWKLPISPAAFELYLEVQETIATMFEGATGRRPLGTPEQLLIDWLHEFQSAYERGEVIAIQLTVLRERLARMRSRIEDLLNPPRTSEFRVCPRCGATHQDVDVEGATERRRAVVLIEWPGNPRRVPSIECRHCGARWAGAEEIEDVFKVEYRNYLKTNDPGSLQVLPEPATGEGDAS